MKLISHLNSTLEPVWLQAMAGYHPHLVVMMTGKARGQLAYIEEVISDFHPGIADEVLCIVVQHWDAFRSLVAESTGYEETKMPLYPNLPFIVSNLECAVRLWVIIKDIKVVGGKIGPQPLKSNAHLNFPEDKL